MVGKLVHKKTCKSQFVRLGKNLPRGNFSRGTRFFFIPKYGTQKISKLFHTSDAQVKFEEFFQYNKGLNSAIQVVKKQFLNPIGLRPTFASGPNNSSKHNMGSPDFQSPQVLIILRNTIWVRLTVASGLNNSSKHNRASPESPQALIILTTIGYSTNHFFAVIQDCSGTIRGGKNMNFVIRQTLTRCNTTAFKRHLWQWEHSKVS